MYRTGQLDLLIRVDPWHVNHHQRQVPQTRWQLSHVVELDELRMEAKNQRP